MLATSLAIFFICGLAAGVLAGLLGVGGGLVIVPLISMILTWQGFDPAHIMHIALGTSLASIVFTSISSTMSHNRRGAVNWPLVFKISPGILIGTFFGTKVASMLSPNFLKIFFVFFLLYVGTQMLLDIKPKASRDLPGAVITALVGGCIGLVSSLVGIGGGSLSVPFMTWCNVPMQRAIGTSAAIGFPIALAGAAGNIFYAYGLAGLPEYSVGFIYLPALIGLVSASVLTAPLGARLAHALPVSKLKMCFAVLLYVMAGKMISDVLKIYF